ncbi:MAG: hypothetical protein WKF97_14200 [Chitinophagaceae bacterium]
MIAAPSNTLYKKLFLFLCYVITSWSLQAQTLSMSDKKKLSRSEDSLMVLADSMVNGLSPARRFRSDSNFVRMLVRTLKTKHSFRFPFDSLQVVSKLYSPDSTFRIFTWQLKKDDYMYLQKGAIQMNTSDGSLKLMPLFDASMFTSKPMDSVRTKSNWIGAIYYRIIHKFYKGKNYYTLLGFDDYSISSNRKWMEVLTFGENGEPVFGGPYISFKDDTTKKAIQPRFGMEYKKEARTTFNYNAELDMIIYDHLISETDEPEKKDTYIPDGDFEGFKWKDGQWVHVDKVFDFKLKDGEFPVDEAIRNNEGNINEEKLMERSIQNEQKAKKVPKPPVKKKSGN